MSIQKTTTDLSTLKINELTQDMYDNALKNGEINSNELYATPFVRDYIVEVVNSNQTITTTSGFNKAISYVLETNLQSAEGGSY